MALIRKSAAGDAVGYHWEEPGDVLTVHAELACQLLRIPGFTEVPPPGVSLVKVTEVPVPKRRGRPPKVRL